MENWMFVKWNSTDEIRSKPIYNPDGTIGVVRRMATADDMVTSDEALLFTMRQAKADKAVVLIIVEKKTVVKERKSALSVGKIVARSFWEG